MAYLAILSIGEGRKSGLSAVAGIALGLLTIGLTAALGVAALISNSTIAYQALRWCGILYLLWLAWDGWNTNKETSPDKINEKAQLIRSFWRGFTTNILNPKAAVFYVSILPTFINTAYNASIKAATLAVIYVCIATAVHLAIVTLAGTLRVFLEQPHHVSILRRFLSLLLAGIAFWFAITTAI